MQKFKVEIKETLSEIIEVEAENLEEALEKAREQYNSEEIVLDSSNFVDVEFNEEQNELTHDYSFSEETNVETLPSKEERDAFSKKFIKTDETKTEETRRRSDLTGEIYTGAISSYYNKHKNETQLYIGEAIVQTIAGELDNDEVKEYFEEYYPEESKAAYTDLDSLSKFLTVKHPADQISSIAKEMDLAADNKSQTQDL